MSEEFKFEDRYIVIKRSDVERFWRDDVRDQFMAALGRLNEHDVRIPQRQYLVIESDWPEFYPAFQMIEARVNGKPAELEVLRAQLANTEQSRRSFFDLSQGLEKRLASLKAFANEMIGAAFEGGSFDGGDIQDIAVKHGLLQIEQRTEECGEVCACREYGFPAECYRKTDLLKPAAPAKCESCGGWGHIETEDSAHDCPECGPSVIERAVEAGVMNAPGKCYEPHDGPKCGDPDCQNDEGSFSVPDCPDCACVQDGDCLCVPSKPGATSAKPKTCIECDQPYCHGVCVERGDQDYDRDQAAKGGCDD